MKVATLQRSFRIRWGFERSGRTVWSTQHLQLDDWPTAVEFIDGDLIVAGKRRKLGNTFVERWSMDYPPLPQSPEFQYACTFPSVTAIYEKNRRNQRVPRFLQALHGTNGQFALIQFSDSDRLFTIDISNGTVELLYTPDEVPALQDKNYDWISSGQHVSLGYVYFYYTGDRPYTQTPHLILFDSNEDGAIESWQLLSDPQWTSLIGPPSNWVQSFD